MKSILIAFSFALCSFTGTAQNLQEHTVSSGETLTSIARTYKTSPYAIIKLNPDAQNGISEGMKLVISRGANTYAEPEPPRVQTTSSNPQTTQEQEREVERFITHKVRRKETLYSIAKRYNITEEDIKRYNKELYSQQLKKRMKIRIPKFKEVDPNDLVEEATETVAYIVKPQETMWSISHRYGLTLEEFKALNPQMGQVLQIGETINVPKTENTITETQNSTIHVVQPKETIYSLTKQYNVSVDQLVRLNPALKDGLKAGMELKLPGNSGGAGNGFIFYEVKPQETMYSLQNKLKMSEEDMVALNPALKDGLKAGMILKLPESANDGQFELNNNLLVERFNILDSIATGSRVNVAFMIPFRLNSISLGEEKEAMARLSKRNLYTVAADFYAGAKLAMEFAAEQGIHVSAKVFDTENSRTKVSNILASNDFSNYQAVIGPLIPDNLEYASGQLRSYDVPVVSPLSDKRIRSTRNLFQSVPKEELLRERMLKYLQEHAADKTVLIIADSKNAVAKAKLLQNFPNATVIKVYEDAYISLPDMQDRIQEFKETWVILESENLELITSATSVLNSQLTPTKKITLFTTYRGDVYDDDNISNSYLSALNFHFPSAECPSEDSPYQQFEQRFYRAYNMMPNRDASRGFDVTLDVILKLAYSGDLYEANERLPSLRLYEGKFEYGKKLLGGYENQGTYIVKYEDLGLKEVQ